MSLVDASDRALKRKMADALGWKIIGHTTAEIRCERTLEFGPRTVVIRGRVPVPLPAEMTASAGVLRSAPALAMGLMALDDIL